jgi:Domain of unknown function (DUF4338)
VPTDEQIFGPGKQRAFSPYLGPDERLRLESLFALSDRSLPGFADAIRGLARKYVDDGDSLKLRAVCLLVADLFEQGWQISSHGGNITFEPPGIAQKGEESVNDVKQRVRSALQAARRRQLQEPSVRQFLEKIERRRKRVGAWATSVLDLIDDGRELSQELARVRALPLERQDEALAALVAPVVEVCEAGKRCPDTGLPLNDIWRYFRHTWAHEYRAIPGRQMLVLIRNAARPNRPIMGIAMLASPVMRLTTRDKWIGWLQEDARERLEKGVWDAVEFASALFERIQLSLDETRWDDLAMADELREPSEAVALRLEQRAAGAAFAREKELRQHFETHRQDANTVRPHRGNLKVASVDADWLAASDDLLFVRKRAEVLARLLFAKQQFLSAGLDRNPHEAFAKLFACQNGRRAIDIVLSELRKAGLSSQVADVSICGAVQPYNELLAGKLVALLLTSQELQLAYAHRYGNQISVIASQMAARPIVKPAELRVLTTTSLYGVGSSQYNRLALRAADHPGLDFDIRWSGIGKSLTGGFGTIHLGNETAQALRAMAFARHDARRVNNRFGEGTSPRLRQIREGLDALGLKSDAILHHATPRIFYGCEMVPGSKSALVGQNYSLARPASADNIADAWRRRWLANRVRREETILAVSQLGMMSVRATLHADMNGQFSLPITGCK